MTTAPENIRRNGRRQIERLGRSAKLTNKQKVEETSHGAHFVATDDSPHDITVVLGNQQVAPFLDDDFGYDIEYDMTFIVRDDGPTENIRGGGGDHASVIEYLDRTFLVETVEYLYEVGMVTLECTEE